jgi:hypothetical protein
MKKHYFLFGLLIATSVTFAWQKTGKVDVKKSKAGHMYVFGAPASRTGAPGELTCATSGCHGGTALDGTTENVFIPTFNGSAVTSYVPGQTYTIGLSLASNPTKKGFQATVLDGSNNFVGTLTASASTGTASVTGMGRTYINQTSAGSAAPVWAFTWTAPAVDAGTVRFYVATIKTNNNGNNSGDVIYTSIHSLGSAVGLKENESAIVKDFTASFSPSNSSVYLAYSSLINGNSNVNIVDMNGRSVLSSELNASTIGLNKEIVRIPESIKNGMYVVHFFVNNVATSKMISIQR